MVEPYEEFESQWAEFHGVKEAVACNTGTAALHLALAALGIGPGDEVIVPEFTMVACANAVFYTGAKPVFVDCDSTLNIDVDLLQEAITEKTKAIMVVHVYGRPCDMQAILEIADTIPVIEDAAEAHGAIYDGKYVGTLGTIGCFSHYKNKIIAAEEGGSCITNDSKLAEKMRMLRSHAFDKEHTFNHQGLGFNYRMANSQATMLLKQDWLSLVRERRKGDGSVTWVHQHEYETEIERNRAYELLQNTGANPRLYFKPMSMQKHVQARVGGRPSTLRAYHYSQIGLYIPYEKRRQD